MSLQRAGVHYLLSSVSVKYKMRLYARTSLVRHARPLALYPMHTLPKTCIATIKLTLSLNKENY